MPSKRVLPEHRAWLRTLIEQYGSSRLVKMIEKGKAAPRPIGRRAENRGNLLAVYQYIEHHKMQKTDGGHLLGIAGACGRLKRLLDARIVNFDLTEDRLRAMYYEAKKGKKAFTATELAAAAAQPYSNERTPLLVKRNSDGSFNVIIDTWAFSENRIAVRK